MPALIDGFQRQDGRKGIRNYVAVAYLVECAHHVARAIATPFAGDGAQLIGFPDCYPNAYAQDMMEALCTHPNVGAMLLVSLGCEQMNRPRLLEVTEQITCGAHITLFSTGRGSVVGSTIAPMIKICANPDTFRRLEEDMDVNAGRIIDEGASLQEVGDEIFALIQHVAAGHPTKSEQLGHQEFLLGYKSFEPLGPSCLPV